MGQSGQCELLEKLCGDTHIWGKVGNIYTGETQQLSLNTGMLMP